MDDVPTEEVLLVEGTDELHVISRLLERHGVARSFQIQPKGGFSELHASIYNELNARDAAFWGSWPTRMITSTNAGSLFRIS